MPSFSSQLQRACLTFFYLKFSKLNIFFNEIALLEAKVDKILICGSDSISVFNQHTNKITKFFYAKERFPSMSNFMLPFCFAEQKLTVSTHSETIIQISYTLNVKLECVETEGLGPLDSKVTMTDQIELGRSGFSCFYDQ